MSDRYEWDGTKAAMNLAKHKIDLNDVAALFKRPTFWPDRTGTTRKGGSRWAISASSPSWSRSWTVTAFADSSRLDQRGKMSVNDYKPGSGSSRNLGRTDFERLRTVTDEEIEAAVGDDPEAAPLDVDWSAAELVVPPRKVPISIRVDEDVLAHFKAEGAGYQRRMNAVLRAFVESRGK